ncbi:MAG: hypothetical protein KBT19_00335 [Lachnospiraceae bacterium]|nr:hypothetical protein [Candidatus Colinaster equi]
MIYKIGFCDMYRNFNKNDNFVTDICKKYDIEYEVTDEPDILFYSVFGNRHNLCKAAVKVFFSGEAIAPNFNECDYAISFDKIKFGDRYCRRPLWYPPKYRRLTSTLTDEQALNRKFCNFVYSNDKDGNAVELRKTFCKKLMEYKQVDCPGRVLHNIDTDIPPREGDWEAGKIDFLAGYKFTIAFENSSYIGYTTEKMTDPLSAQSVPIYWGNPEVEEDFNPAAYICCNGYEDNMDKIIEKIIELDKNDEAYLRMLRANPMQDNYDVDEYEHFERFIADIVTGVKGPIKKDPMNFTRRMSYESLSRKEKLKFLFLK